MGELRQIPGVGKETEQDLIAIGYSTVYYASTPPEQREPQLLKWWNWKD